MNFLTGFRFLLKQIKNHHINEYAVQCAYYIILSFIPFIILLFSLIQWTNLGRETIFFLAQEIFPGNVYTFVENVIMEASFKSVETLSFSFVLLIWSAGNGFFALCKGFNSIYETTKRNNYWFIKLKSIISIILFILLIFIALFFIAIGNRIVSFIHHKFNTLYLLINIFLKWRILWQNFTLFLFFLLMYKYVPNHKIKFKTQIPGALFAAFSWYLLSYFFSLYLNIFRNFSIIYGSLTSIILLMIWVYWCMFSILVGAEINIYFPKSQKEHLKN